MFEIFENPGFKKGFASVPQISNSPWGGGAEMMTKGGGGIWEPRNHDYVILVWSLTQWFKQIRVATLEFISGPHGRQRILRGLLE